MCPHCYLIAAAFLLFGFVSTHTKEPENHSQLAKLLHKEYGLDSLLNRDNQIYLVSIEDASDIVKAIDRIVEIPTIEAVAFHWELERMPVDGDVIKKLGRLPKLTVLDARYCKIRDDDSVGLKELTQLKELRLSGNPITDATLTHLKSLKHLELLYLDNTKVTGSGFKQLQSLPRLRNLYLRGTPITDESMIALGTLNSLQVLVMSDTAISHKGIMHLTGLYHLHNLVVEAKVGEDFRKEHAVARAEAKKKGLLPNNHPELTLIGR